MSRWYRSVAATATAALLAHFFIANAAFSQSSPKPTTMMPHDPGVRAGLAGAGGPLPGLGTAERYYFNAARARFQAVDSVSGTINDASPGILGGSGLGPRFNMNRCAG